MKKTLIIIIFLFNISGLIAQNVWSDKTRVLPDKLRGLPVGIRMSHDPNPCHPELIDSIYYWKHHTKAIAIDKQLTVVECGSFIWYSASGWQANITLSPAEFAEAFNCTSAVLKVKRTYTYQKNWRYGKQPYGGDALWYVIAKDKNGKLYKGYALIETEGK